MQWYVYLIAIPVAAFLGQLTIELLGRPVQTMWSLRQQAREWMFAFRDTPLPGPRELAVSSRQIREYDQTMQNLRHAQRTFADLGAQLFAFSETEPPSAL
ncbi:hypothetical protein [Bradyrhizobium erythrophlei]|uniref:Uncharacterized protein n=1 Tax=Bradyrhizobium erythrophlei TaxID=1437360 RepID=A0A1M7UI52_9BRAD|nr:hypothetical protein [Bradyrhizobium erythrophlei]SHN82590.1 hypothetical protein SAMN05444170_5161 [Bradyrhizobium erythrophlei]